MLESGPMFHERIEDCSAVQDVLLDFLVGAHEPRHEREDVVEEGRRDRDHALKRAAEYHVALFRWGRHEFAFRACGMKSMRRGRCAGEGGGGLSKPSTS